VIPDELLNRLVSAASLAPSADNMQAWAFAGCDDGVEVYLEPSRVLPTDVDAMFAWVGLGAAVENLVIAAGHEGFACAVDYRILNGARSFPSVQDPAEFTGPVLVRLTPGGSDDPLAAWIGRRETNRAPFDASPLESATLEDLTHAVDDLAVGVHWISGSVKLNRIAALDARSTYIRLEHRPLHDELFDILRFSRRELEDARFGLEFASIGIPFALVWFARLLRFPSVMKVVSRLGIGRAVARRLAARLRAAGAVCLVTARAPGPAGYVEAGRAMQRLWLEATARGLAVQPHGVLPQYLTKLDVEPDGFTPRYAGVMRQHRDPFDSLFPAARGERPAIVLRLGRTPGHPPHQSVRLPVDRLLRRHRGSVCRGVPAAPD